ncbi:hydroxyectoine utilization dehydratase EutB [Pseudooceanicola algae]|uniref:Phenylserine dehydratase n=1 Tax=Pseudooceanicola algae TaxID=1537215 RepID=A0A418SK27_9RHOB|nr:hydroxyectoine utilization dehydratase EutB [Pseudooceanicola algae]QPM92197.1 Phenylserine dehydratase [Pseudooceanicola algae]
MTSSPKSAATLTLSDILSARRVLRGQADATPMVPSAKMSAHLGQEFLLKLETTQPIGAFKLRGALNAIANLPPDTAGVTCCSTGNHGRGVAHAARARGMRAVVCMSALVPQAKVDGIRALGAEVRICGTSQDEAEAESQRLAQAENLAVISPFDDPHVIAGQGTIGIEMMEARPDLDLILVPLSGGGLAAGVALAVKTVNPRTRVIGVSMDRGAAMHLSLAAGHPVAVTEVASLADSLGGGIGMDNAFSFALCRRHLDATILVTEAEIRDAMQALFFEDRMVAEGASVVGLAAALAGKLPPLRGPVGTILTGRNLDMDQFLGIMAGRDIPLGDLTLKGRAYAP